VVSFNPLTGLVALADFKTKFAVNPTAQVLGPFLRKLGNSDDTLDLEKPDPEQGQGHVNQGLVPYILVERLAYSSNAPWPAGANGTGKTLQRKDPLAYGNDPANWEVKLPTAGVGGVVPNPDSDADGLPDAWETAQGFRPQNPQDAQMDQDQDGLTNLHEYWSGTDPKNAASVLCIRTIEADGGGLRIRFDAAPGKAYTVQRRSSAASGDWQDLQHIEPTPTNRIEEVSDLQNGSSSSYYRLKIHRATSSY